ncbi:MAG: Crp/Fnr family transcriptional regulator [Desulfopila sp.]
MRFLQKNLLEHLQGKEFEQLRASFLARSFVKQEYISVPAGGENFIFIVQSGRLRVYLGYEEKEFSLAILSPGDIYATHAGTFVQALEDSELLVTDVATFRRQMASDGVVNRAMIRVLGNILQSSFGIIDGLVFKDTSCRLLSLLLNEAKHHEIRADGSVLLEIELSVEQIAGLVGASRQTVSTELNRLIKEGILEKGGRGMFVVPDPERLAAEYRARECS